VTSDGARPLPTLGIRLVAGERTLRSWEVPTAGASIGASEKCAITVSGDPSLRPHHVTLHVEGEVVTAIPAPGASITLDGRVVDVGIVSGGQILGAGKLHFRVELLNAAKRADPNEVVAWLTPADRERPAVVGVRVTAPGHPSKVVALPERSVLVGAGKAHLKLPFAEVADQHATLRVGADGTVRVTANEDQVVRVNGTLVQKAVVRVGDEVMVGVVRLEFVPAPVRLPLLKAPAPAAGSDDEHTMRIHQAPRLRAAKARSRTDELHEPDDEPLGKEAKVVKTFTPPTRPAEPEAPKHTTRPGFADDAPRRVPTLTPATRAEARGEPLIGMPPPVSADPAPRVDPGALGGTGRAIRPALATAHDDPPSTADPRTADPRTEVAESPSERSARPRVSYTAPRPVAGEKYGRVDPTERGSSGLAVSDGARNLGTAPIPMPNVPGDRGRRGRAFVGQTDEQEEPSAPADLGYLLIEADRRQEAVDGPTVLGASIIRVVDNRIADTITLHAEQEYVSSGGELRCWVEEMQVHFEVGPKVRAADGFALRRVDGGKQRGSFGEGGRVSLIGSNGRYRIDAMRVPKPPRSWTDLVINVSGIALVLVLLVLCGWMSHMAGLVDLSSAFGELAPPTITAPLQPTTATTAAPSAAVAAPERAPVHEGFERVKLRPEGLRPAMPMDDRVIGENHKAVVSCYETALQRNPTLQGQLAMQWTISGEGKVLESKVVQSTLGGGVGECVREAIEGWKFPTRLKAPTVVDHVFEFRLAKE
jgi:hypothetical protein